MIVHEYKTIFVHVPKTAGVSLVHAILSPILKKETKGPISGLSADIQKRFRLTTDQKHLRACDYVQTISPKVWNEYYKFAFVRNPWDRAVSEFAWRVSRQKTKFFATFEEFVNLLKTLTLSPKPPVGDYEKDLWLHTIPQYEFISNESSVIINDVFRFEELNNNIKTLSERIGINLNINTYNRSNHDHYQDYYTPTTKNTIEILYQKDIEAFGYTFED